MHKQALLESPSLTHSDDCHINSIDETEEMAILNEKDKHF